MDYENLTPQYRIEEYLEAIVEGWADATLVAYPEVPSWRIEEFLDAFITYIWEDGDHPRKPCPDPVWRLEECLRAIYDVMTGAATPWAFPLPTTNRIEEYLAAIHAYLADGTELPVPEPVWRIEQWLAYALDAVKQGGGVEKTVSGTMVHITDALAKAALSVLASIEPIQDLHGYANPWPGGGGINKAKVVYKTVSASAEYRNLQDNSVTVFSNSTTAGYRYAQFALLDAEGYAGQTLTFSAKAQQVTGSSIPRILGRLYDSNGSSVGSAIFEKTGTSITHTFTLPATIDSGVTFRVSLYCNSNQAEATETNFYDIQVEVGSTAHDFAPYENICPISGRTGCEVYVSPTQSTSDATTYFVDWSSHGTVYGGTVDVITGELTITHACVDMGDLTYGYISSDTVFYTNLADKVDGALLMKCSCYKTGGDTGYSTPDYTVGFSSVSSLKKRIFIGDPRYTSPSDLKTALAGQTLYYWLATPLTYQLTPQEVQMLLGENYVWSSSGDTVSVTYYAEGNANPLQSLNILLGGNYSNPKTADDVSDKEALEIILGGNK